eukprot:40555-Chlamydomonas_euryale.AAC.12
MAVAGGGQTRWSLGAIYTEFVVVQLSLARSQLLSSSWPAKAPRAARASVPAGKCEGIHPANHFELAGAGRRQLTATAWRGSWRKVYTELGSGRPDGSKPRHRRRRRAANPHLVCGQPQDLLHIAVEALAALLARRQLHDDDRVAVGDAHERHGDRRRRIRAHEGTWRFLTDRRASADAVARPRQQRRAVIRQRLATKTALALLPTGSGGAARQAFGTLTRQPL